MAYKCNMCGFEEEEEGECPDCKIPLSKEQLKKKKITPT